MKLCLCVEAVVADHFFSVLSWLFLLIALNSYIVSRKTKWDAHCEPLGPSSAVCLGSIYCSRYVSGIRLGHPSARFLVPCAPVAPLGLAAKWRLIRLKPVRRENVSGTWVYIGGAGARAMSERRGRRAGEAIRCLEINIDPLVPPFHPTPPPFTPTQPPFG